jgi:hypothetical protein
VNHAVPCAIVAVLSGVVWLTSAAVDLSPALRDVQLLSVRRAVDVDDGLVVQANRVED